MSINWVTVVIVITCVEPHWATKLSTWVTVVLGLEMTEPLSLHQELVTLEPKMAPFGVLPHLNHQIFWLDHSQKPSPISGRGLGAEVAHSPPTKFLHLQQLKNWAMDPGIGMDRVFWAAELICTQLAQFEENNFSTWIFSKGFSLWKSPGYGRGTEMLNLW